MSTLTLEQVISQADVLCQQGNSAAAIQGYQNWLASNPSQTNLRYVALFNLGFILRASGQLDEAIEAYQKALAIKPDFYQAAVNLGLAHESHGDINLALSTWNSALQSIEAQTLLLNHLGRVYEDLKNYDNAESLLKRSLMIDPEQPDALQHYLYIRQKKCQWPVLQAVAGITTDKLQDGCGPLGLLALIDDPAVQLRVIKDWVARKVPRNRQSLAPMEGYKHRKLRIGYFSCDFRWHAVSILTAELFELHDRQHFEIYALDYSTDDKGAMRQRVLAAMDHHVPIQNLSDEEAAKQIRQHEIDILVDLTGLTAGARPGILAYKPAPIQISYLGFVATSGMEEIDYVLADRFVLPESLAEFYIEKPLYLPEVYQVNDSKREIGETPTRESCGLPEKAFVFCSFNGSYKITPEVFAVWMRILVRTPNSVLWLVADNDWARDNLIQTALKHGVGKDRLIFAGKVVPTEYLARYRVADLLLDTSPYNAGTTASDALWVGLPVLTCPGRTFASRMAGSLLQGVGLPELIAMDWQTYEDMAVRFAHHPEQLKVLRERLQASSRVSALFDSQRFVRNLETALKSVARDPRKMPSLTTQRDTTLEIVSATRLNEADFWQQSALGLSLKRLQAEKRMTAHIFYENNRSLSEVYNERIQAESDTDILVFIHDDVWLDDYHLVNRLIEGLTVYDIVGQVGNRRRVEFQPSWAYIPDGQELKLDDRSNFSGFAANGKQPFAAIDFYGESPAECQLLDGLFLAAYRDTLINHKVTFDPRFDFHFYDLDFCRTASDAGLKLGTWPICLTHQSVGVLGSDSWITGMKRYFEKWTS